MFVLMFVYIYFKFLTVQLQRPATSELYSHSPTISQHRITSFFVFPLSQFMRAKVHTSLNGRFRFSYSHSMVAGGLLVMSYTTRLMWATSFTIRVDIFSSTSHGILAQSEVIPSIEVTARIPMV
jgi:hypothetical protein